MGKQMSTGAVPNRNFAAIPIPTPIDRHADLHPIMPTKKMTVIAKARKAMPDSANRPKTKVAGSTKKNTRMQPVLSDKNAKTARKKSGAH